jgi:hypothetical protein
MDDELWFFFFFFFFFVRDKQRRCERESTCFVRDRVIRKRKEVTSHHEYSPFSKTFAAI